MNIDSEIPAIPDLKQQAKRLRQALADEGDFVSHSESLELVARQYGVRDWNTLYAMAGNRPHRRGYQNGDRVAGHYLGQPFQGTIRVARPVDQYGYRLTIDFDEPVDVVTFDSFSSFRKRVTATINEKGMSPQRTSNGRPQMEIQS